MNTVDTNHRHRNTGTGHACDVATHLHYIKQDVVPLGGDQGRTRKCFAPCKRMGVHNFK